MPVLLKLTINKNILVIFLSIFFSQLVQADIYIYIDSNGNQHFSERKVNDKYRLLLRSETNKAPATFKNWKEKSYTNISVPRNKTLQNRYHPLIVNAAQKYQLEPEFLHAVITAESSYRRKAVSSAGAQGLMQLMPVTAERFGVDDPFDPKQSINAGALYLNKLLKEFKSKELALAAYNAGEGTVRRYNKQIPPYPETQQYVKKVIGFYWYYKDNL
ncbi:lytic transglycosylase domain-containing protein [Psychromonas sp. psych-6C06]|uniref:lytic transglycosylase domain-containing protein n=1 Tax=Psychromonas sp. psych-6C06 TaxID=2058089 RepID=UPI000C32A21C|nr:lytic transglycosylase domain-containing protein [Psychromonas sp. psych-6C06]PKF61730.1 lytic transglycosylase domain-containing protein [Psychromonas sp. psych-6C06]